MAAQSYAEVVASPYSVWVAAPETAFPAIDADEATFAPGWFQLGTNGINNQGTDGVTVNLGSTVQTYTPAGGTLPVKAWRTEETASVAFSIVDTSIEQFAKVLDDATVTTTAASTGVAGEKSFKLTRGIIVATYALLVRGVSPYDDGTGLQAQYEFSRVYQSGSQAPKYGKDAPSELACEFSILGEVTGTDPALYRAQTDPAV